MPHRGFKITLSGVTVDREHQPLMEKLLETVDDLCRMWGTPDVDFGMTDVAITRNTINPYASGRGVALWSKLVLEAQRMSADGQTQSPHPEVPAPSFPPTTPAKVGKLSACVRCAATYPNNSQCLDLLNGDLWSQHSFQITNE